MLKWAKTRQRRESECSNDVETCSTVSSDSSESSITVPIRYHERRASRPKSLALSSNDVLDLDQEHPVLTRGGYRTASTQMLPGSRRGSVKRHSMLVSGTRDVSKLYSRTDNDNNNDLNAADVDDGILRISTADCDKPKSRNSFWKNLRAKAQGKRSDRKLEKAHSLSNIPALGRQSETDATTPTNSTTSTTPVTLRKEQRTLADCVSPSRAKASVIRRRSFKLIKKQNESKKPKAFTKINEPAGTEGYLPTGSPDSGISSIRGQSVSSSADSDGGSSPVSPITPINLPSDSDAEMSCIRQQFTSAVLEYLNERLEKKGYNSIIDRSSSTSSTQSEDGAPDIFCYDTDTVARRPSHSLSNKHRVPISH